MGLIRLETHQHIQKKKKWNKHSGDARYNLAMVHVLKCKLIKKYFWFFILTFIDIVGMASVFDHIMSIHEWFGQKGFLCFSYITINPIACQNFQFLVIQRTKEPHCILWYTAFGNRVKLFFPRLTFIKMYDIKTG